MIKKNKAHFIGQVGLIVLMLLAIQSTWGFYNNGKSIAATSGKWVTDGDTCYWLENEVKSQAHKHTETALAEYITKYSGNYAIISECPTCHQKGFKVTHEHQLVKVGPVIWNPNTYWKTGNYVIETGGRHWFYDYCTVEGCDYHGAWYDWCNCKCSYEYDTETNKVTTTYHCLTCDNEWEETETHKSHRWSGNVYGHYYKCLDGNYHQWTATQYCCECGVESEVGVDEKALHYYRLEDKHFVYKDGKVYMSQHCWYCGYSTTEYLRECDHNADYVTFTYKAIEGSNLQEKICSCCGKTVEYVEGE